MSARLLFLRDALPVARYEHRPLRGELSSGEVKISHKFVTPSTSRFRNGQDRFPTEHFIIRAIPHNSKSRYGERGAAEAKPKAQIILDAAKVSTASGGNSEPKQEQRSQSARGFCPPKHDAGTATRHYRAFWQRRCRSAAAGAVLKPRGGNCAVLPLLFIRYIQI